MYCRKMRQYTVPLSYKFSLTRVIACGIMYLADKMSAKKCNNAGWSSPVARWAHNPKVVGSNPAPATSRSGLTDLKLCKTAFLLQSSGV